MSYDGLWAIIDWNDKRLPRAVVRSQRLANAVVAKLKDRPLGVTTFTQVPALPDGVIAYILPISTEQPV